MKRVKPVSPLPSKEAREKAVGDLSTLPECLQRAFQPVPQEAYSNLKNPHRGEWLAEQKEVGQSFTQFQRMSMRQQPHAYFDTIYILPIGQFVEGFSPSPNDLCEFAGIFFGVKVACLDAIDENLVSKRARVGHEGQRQLNTEEILEFLRSMRLPRNAFCVVGITMLDLYPNENYNFVFGIASLMDGVGVYSFSRYMPGNHFAEHILENGILLSREDQEMLLYRSLKVFCHETCHILGMKHCTYYSCRMNGSNHLEESDSHPIDLCPVCLRKLQESTRVDIIQRYENLQQWFSQRGLEEDTNWVQQRINAIIEGLSTQQIQEARHWCSGSSRHAQAERKCDRKARPKCKKAQNIKSRKSDLHPQ